MAEPLTVGSVGIPLITKLATAFAESAKGMAGKAKEKLEIRFKKGFAKYVDEQRGRFSTVKTIISSSTPIPLNDLYVNLFVAREKQAHRDEDFLTEMARYKNVLFTATAGAGKSMLMRYLYLKFLEVQDQRLPVFVELRDLNQSSAGLTELIRAKIADYLEGFSIQQLKYALDTGRIVLFFDGFDEIDHDKRKTREREINELAGRFQKLWTFVSSRPAETFASWEKFHVFQVQPFTQKQVELLISKIAYDEEIKNLFRKKLSEGLYSTHKEFLTNPLLTIMMLITLEQFAEVPAKIHLFYEYAFEALFGRHDVTKGGFQRKRHTALALDDFKRLFAYFCIITYMRELYTFSSDRTLEIIQQSIHSSQIDADKLQFRNDLTESTCMLVLDGLDYTFSHRSFQEYFSAYFLSRIKPDEFERVLPRLVLRDTFDNVLNMISEMSKEKFEEAWALPALRKLCERVKDVDGSKNHIGYATRLIGGEPKLIFPRPEGHLMVSFRYDRASQDEPAEANLRMALFRIYGVFDNIHARLAKMDLHDEKIAQKIKNGELLKNDRRFDAIRASSQRPQQGNEQSGIPLSENDNEWLHNCYFGRFISLESELLPKLKRDVERRVAQRAQGLAEIFSLAEANKA
jgi:hypothetical protein